MGDEAVTTIRETIVKWLVFKCLRFSDKKHRGGSKKQIPEIQDADIGSGAAVESVLPCLLKPVALRLKQQYHLSPTFQTPENSADCQSRERGTAWLGIVSGKWALIRNKGEKR